MPNVITAKALRDTHASSAIFTLFLPDSFFDISSPSVSAYGELFCVRDGGVK